MIIDQDTSWVKQLSVLLNSEEDMVVTGTASSLVEGCKLVKFIQPHVVLLETSKDGVQRIKGIQECSNAKIIVITHSLSTEFVRSALLAGAKEYINKENFRMIPEMIRIIHQRWSTAEIMAQMVWDYEGICFEKRKDNLFTDFQLTHSERRIFNCLEQQKTRTEIAAELCVSENTVKNHITKILDKLKVKSSREAVIKVRGILENS
jgi:NarL family two-component system response regulator LiaR